MDVTEASDQIINISRQARFADTTSEEWGKRVAQLIAAQPGLSNPEVTNVRPVGTSAGGSNGTLLLDAAFDGPNGREKRGLVLRFLPDRGLFHRYDVGEQFALQKALRDTAVPVPEQLWLDAEGKYLVRPGYVMEKREGTSPAMSWMTDGIIAEASPEDRREISLDYVGALAKVHAVDWRAAGLAWLENRAKGSRPIEREVNWYWDALTWSGGEKYAAGMETVRDWLIANEPADIEPVLCHGDANFGNYLYVGTKVSAVLDWEMAFLGAPEADLTFLKIAGDIMMSEVPYPEGVHSYEEMLAEYERISGRPIKYLPYFELFTSYRVGIITVLSIPHFSEEALAGLMPIFERGPAQCLARAAAMGIAVPARQGLSDLP